MSDAKNEEDCGKGVRNIRANEARIHTHETSRTAAVEGDRLKGYEREERQGSGLRCCVRLAWGESNREKTWVSACEVADRGLWEG